MQVVYAQEPLPTKVKKTIFLAGPSPRTDEDLSWRPEALRLLELLKYDGHVFSPEPRDGKFQDYTGQIEWETAALERADVILFWIPRTKMMPGLTTNVEWGVWMKSGKVILSSPDGAESMRYLKHLAVKYGIPSFDSLPMATLAAIDKLGAGSERNGEGECQVPLNVWTHPTFQAWYAAQVNAGNKLNRAKVLWTFRVGPKQDIVFSWVVQVEVYIAREGRVKNNEFVLGRTDLASVVMYHYPESEGFTSAEIVLVREFRSPGRTKTGFVYDLPGGSSKNTEDDTLKVVVAEIEEETSFKVDPSRLYRVGKLQVAATLSAHTCALYGLELDANEMRTLKEIAARGKPFGVLEDSERTYVEVLSFQNVMERDLLDWSTVGMVLTTLMGGREMPYEVP